MEKCQKSKTHKERNQLGKDEFKHLSDQNIDPNHLVKQTNTHTQECMKPEVKGWEKAYQANMNFFLLRKS